MTSFASLLSSLGAQVPPDTAAAPENGSQSIQRSAKLDNSAARPLTGSTQQVAGVKRSIDDSGADGSRKAPKGDRHEERASDVRINSSVPSSRFQLSSKGNAGQKPTPTNSRPPSKAVAPLSAAKPLTKPVARSVAVANSATTSNTGSTPVVTSSAPKRGFASILEKAKAAQEAAKAAGPSGIVHRPVERLSKREKLRQLEEQKAQQAAAKRNRNAPVKHSRAGSLAGGHAVKEKKSSALSYKGTMKKAPQALGYKGTMRKLEPGENQSNAKKKNKPEGKYGGYASWSDLDVAESGEEDDWESEASSDMEGGFDDVEREELLALQAAKQEDKEALEAEERHQREKLERKRKLLQLSKSAAAKKRY